MRVTSAHKRPNAGKGSAIPQRRVSSAKHVTFLSAQDGRSAKVEESESNHSAWQLNPRARAFQHNNGGSTPQNR